MNTLIWLRVIFCALVLYGVVAVCSTLIATKRTYKRITKKQINGPRQYLANTNVVQSWQRLYIQLALLAIWILGGFIPIHRDHDEGTIYRTWITIIHISMTLVMTWKNVQAERARRVLVNMIGAEEDE